MILNGEKHLGNGFFAEVGPKKAVVVESHELIGLLSNYHKEEIIVNEIDLLKENNEVIKTYRGKYIVDSVIDIEATFFPLR